ncbi:hypothetical protein FRC03_012954 [Tulasnella sp. 419]|nr:hypothetical protein FRC03_012954 [Tulasnella sp. 419]
MLRYASIFILSLVASTHAQSITVSTAFSNSLGFTGNRVPVTFTVPIPVTITLANPQPTGTGQQSGGGQSGGSNTAGNTGAPQNGTVAATSQATTPTTTSTLPSAPLTTMDPSVLAPYPGTTIAGVNLGPGDDYIASGATETVQMGTMLGVALAGMVLGVQQVVVLI